jgi:hypothetical protein
VHAQLVSLAWHGTALHAGCRSLNGYWCCAAKLGRKYHEMRAWRGWPKLEARQVAIYKPSISQPRPSGRCQPLLHYQDACAVTDACCLPLNGDCKPAAYTARLTAACGLQIVAQRARRMPRRRPALADTDRCCYQVCHSTPFVAATDRYCLSSVCHSTPFIGRHRSLLPIRVY